MPLYLRKRLRRRLLNSERNSEVIFAKSATYHRAYTIPDSLLGKCICIYRGFYRKLLSSSKSLIFLIGDIIIHFFDFVKCLLSILTCKNHYQTLVLLNSGKTVSSLYTLYIFATRSASMRSAAFPILSLQLS